MSFRTFRKTLVVLAASIVIANAATAENNSLTVSPITATPTNEIHNGKLVWVDLVTTDPGKAAAFYATVFGWQAKQFADDGYIELLHDGQPVCAVVRFEDGEAQVGDARWLVSISVEDVDAATKRAANNGGTVLESATDLPGRGRYSVISDSQGAVLMLLRATGGDPVDAKPTLNEWAWAELWTNDREGAIAFYSALAGYDAIRIPDADGDERVVLGTEGKARATIVSLPWDDVEPNWLPYIPVADAAETLQRITTAGGAVLLQSADVHEAIVMDPTGGVFAIQQKDDGR